MTDEKQINEIRRRECDLADDDAMAGDVSAAAKRLRDLKGYVSLKHEFDTEGADEERRPDDAFIRARLEQELSGILAAGEQAQTDGDGAG
ncbi:MAG: hypothetical protein CME88_13290 [Hirschia sp.]|nr:hypothetical protein [Hirschia sp.]MBF19344.1 hypothetical protein [Hirschia sp.]|tara:strand:+ start:151 stop:420 length:270 start_codon:yes stop_codon:yes gene_type:complete